MSSSTAPQWFRKIGGTPPGRPSSRYAKDVPAALTRALGAQAQVGVVARSCGVSLSMAEVPERFMCQ
jgi:hypothetical protein